MVEQVGEIIRESDFPSGTQASDLVPSGDIEELIRRRGVGSDVLRRGSPGVDVRAIWEEGHAARIEVARQEAIRIEQERVVRERAAQQQAFQQQQAIRQRVAQQRFVTTREGVKEEAEVINGTRIIKIDPRTGKPFGRVKVAPTSKEQFREARLQRGQILGTLSFVGGKVGEKVLKREPTSPTAPFRGPALARLTQKTIEIGPFFIPYVGPVLAIGTGGEALVTKRGRERIVLQAEQLEAERGIPRGVGITGQVVLSAAMVYGGTRLTFRNIEKVAGLPKTDVKILGVTKGVQDKKIITDVVFQARTRKLFGIRTDIGIARGVTRVGDAGKVQLAETITAGKFVQRGIKLPSTKTVPIGKPTKFISRQVSVTRPSDITLSVKEKGLLISRQRAGFEQLSTGKVITTKTKEPAFFVGRGGAFQVGKPTFIFGRTRLVEKRKLLRVGKGEFKGIIFRVTEKEKVIRFVPSPSKLPAPSVSQLSSQEVTRLVSPIQAAVVSTRVPIPSVIKAIVPIISAPKVKQIIVKQPKAPTITGRVTEQFVSPKIKQPVAQVPKTKQRMRIGLKQVSSAQQRQSEKQLTKFIQAPAQIQKKRLLQRPRQALLSLTALKQKQKQVFKAPPITIPFLPIITPVVKRLPILPRFKIRRRPTERELTPTFGVQVRRFGVFRPIGTGLTLKEAFAVGRERVSRTLGATFRITGMPKELKVPVGFYAKPTRKGILFIEKRRFRLSTRPEVREIHRAKRRKK